MKRIVAILLCLLIASPSWAAWSDIGALGTATSTSSGTTLVITTSATLEVGNVAAVCVSVDNQSATDGNTNEVSLVTDSAGNTYVKAREFVNGEGAADEGVVTALFLTRATVELASGQTITITLANTKTAKAAVAHEFGAADSIQVAGGGDVANDSGGIDPIVISALPSKEYLFIRCIGRETNSAAATTPTASYTLSANAIASGGSIALSQRAEMEYRIFTAAGDTSDPSITAGDNKASVFVAMEEIVAGVITPTVRTIVVQ